MLASAMVGMAAPEARSSASLLALADQCVQCGLCLPHCPTYRLDATEAESPRGRIAYMKALAGGNLAPSEIGDRHLDHCLGCRRCESACPAGVKYGALLVGSRAGQFERKAGKGTGRTLRRLLAAPRLLRLLLKAYRSLHPLLPAGLRPLPRPQSAAAGTRADPAAETALFVGCIATGYESHARAGLLRLLAAVGTQASIPDAQACCGTAALHAGDQVQAQALAAANRSAFAGRARVLCLATGCQESLSASLDGLAEVTDAIAFLESRGEALKFRSAGGRRVALHLPCSSQRSATRGDEPLRRLLARVPDLDLVELPDTGCCGAAGLHMFSEPERANAFRAPLLESLANSRAQELLSANIGCRLHLANASELPIRHPIEFLAEQLA
ncbi:MAG: (Fe-S)-binding protein [Arenimonas sp.]|nr:(Fe-S)-binding protein [Arenimonas sp.]